jgi:transglutaminase superfamily protein
MNTRQSVKKAGAIVPWIILAAVFPLLSLFAGCTFLETKGAQTVSEESVGTWTMETYQQFLADNQKHINHLYSDDYEDYLFLVDTDEGARPIQDLISAETVRSLWTGKEHLSDSEKVSLYYSYIEGHFTYIPTPNKWPVLEQTLKSREGDCKGLSLLLISLLLSADLECYGAINHGHMWVNVKVGGKWKVLETDSDPDRNTIYQSPGFYELPLFKVYHHKTQKRVRKKEQEMG